MKEFVQKIVRGNFGLVSAVAEQCLVSGNFEDFIDFLGQQSCIDAPASMQRKLGDDLYNEIVELYEKLPKDKKSYTTGLMI